MTDERMSRDCPMPPGSDMTKMSCQTPFPTMLMRIMESSIPGMQENASTILCTMRSNHPPITAESVPITTAMNVVSTDTPRQRMTDVLAP